MPRKVMRLAWTKTEIKSLKTMAKQKLGASKIAKSLKRSVPAVKMRASNLGVSLSTR